MTDKEKRHLLDVLESSLHHCVPDPEAVKSYQAKVREWGKMAEGPEKEALAEKLFKIDSEDD